MSEVGQFKSRAHSTYGYRKHSTITMKQNVFVHGPRLSDNTSVEICLRWKPFRLVLRKFRSTGKWYYMIAWIFNTIASFTYIRKKSNIFVIKVILSSSKALRGNTYKMQLPFWHRGKYTFAKMFLEVVWNATVFLDVHPSKYTSVELLTFGGYFVNYFIPSENPSQLLNCTINTITKWIRSRWSFDTIFKSISMEQSQ